MFDPANPELEDMYPERCPFSTKTPKWVKKRTIIEA